MHVSVGPRPSYPPKSYPTPEAVVPFSCGSQAQAQRLVVEVPATRMYAGGGAFVKYGADGGSMAYYPSGRMAACYERMAAGFFMYFYADDSKGTTLLAIDPQGCGYCAYPDGKPRLTSAKTHGSEVGRDGSITRSWNTLKPLSSKITMDLSQYIRVEFASRQVIDATLTCNGLTEAYQIGEVQKMATDSYLQKVTHQIKMGPERGKYVLDVDKCRAAAAANRERREAMAMKDLDVAKTHVTEDDMRKHPELRPIVAATSALQRRVADGAMKVRAPRAGPNEKPRARLWHRGRSGRRKAQCAPLPLLPWSEWPPGRPPAHPPTRPPAHLPTTPIPPTRLHHTHHQ